MNEAVEQAKAKAKVLAVYPGANVAEATDGNWEVWRGVMLDSPYTTNKVIGWGESPTVAWWNTAKNLP